MSYRELTIGVCCTLAIVLIAWDLFVLYGNDEDGDTVSAIVRKESLTFWLLPYAFGVVGGHLFLPGMPLPCGNWWGLVLLVVLGLLVGVAGLRWGRSLSTHRFRIVLRAFGLLNFGLVMGHLFWPM